MYKPKKIKQTQLKKKKHINKAITTPFPSKQSQGLKRERLERERERETHKVKPESRLSLFLSRSLFCLHHRKQIIRQK